MVAGTSHRVVICVAAAAALAAGLGAAAAHADGDPASDYLIAQKVFLPYDAKIPQVEQRKLLAAVQSANKQGFKIKVALIWSDYDLGAVTVLWRKPRTYARFLGEELSYYFKGRLLIVMPSGFGFNYLKHDNTKAAYAVLEKIQIGDTTERLASPAKSAGTTPEGIIGVLGVMLAAGNAVGGYVVTARMMAMLRSRTGGERR